MKFIGKLGLTMTLLMTAVVPRVSAADMKTLIIAEPGHNIGYLPLYIAIRKGYFAADGLDVKMMTLDSGSEHANAVLSGQAFAFIGGPEHDAFAKLKGGELRTVVNIVNRGNVYYEAPKGKEPAPGQSMADYFKGKTIAVSAYGGTPNSITRYLLNKYNLDPRKDVVMQEMSNAAILAGVRSRNAAIGVTQEPLIMQGIRAGIWNEPFINIPQMLGPYAYSTINVSLATIKNDPTTVKNFVAGVIRALHFAYEDQAGATAIAKLEFPTMSSDDLKATIDRTYADEMWSKDGSVTRDSWTTAQSVVLAAGVLAKPVPYDDIIDMEFVDSSHASATP
ncbi:MAG TPA: ABC transporter substrate-binding protein [Beijerinckiaceae bacterium]|jgi:NitT/TauT family transport system substrate-binding protein|nr:ABC transporter substrate-binding protein [Beijerinckiaceae bacterium]